MAQTPASGQDDAQQSVDESAGTLEVSQYVDRPPEQIWKRLTTKEGIEALLGPGAMLGGKGEPWRAADGTHGVVRSYHPGEQVRVSWHADEDAPASLVDLRIVPEGGGTRVDLRHEHVEGAVGSSGHDGMRERWQRALRQLTDEVSV